MRHPWQIWSAYVVALLLAAIAVGGVTFRALAAEKAEQEARAQGAVEENIRLALWRMDSLMVPFIAQESARSFNDYRSLLSPRRSTTQSPKSRSTQPVAGTSSPFSGTHSSRVTAYFDFDPSEKKLAALINPARGESGTSKSADKSTSPGISDPACEDLEKLLSSRAVAAELPEPAVGEPPLVEFANTKRSLPGDGTANSVANNYRIDSRQLAERGNTEYQLRSQYAANTLQEQRLNGFVPPAGPVRVGLMRPLVISGELILARQALVGNQTHVQGCWLDWSAVQQTLTDSVADLVPNAKMSLVAGSSQTEPGRMLASLPVQIEWHGNLDETILSGAGSLSRPLQISLALAWFCLGLVAVAAAVVLRGVLALSERRASFVSAVTHELRTPLTTFKMYAEMLAEGMVPDESSRRRYLETLRSEADRLSHLVENVLAYARLERGGLGNRIRAIAVDELLQLILPRAADRARQSGLEIDPESSAQTQLGQALADPSAVEQIFFNLIDNAAKYAVTATDRRIHVRTDLQERFVLLKVSDHGPGLSPDQRRSLFEPFHKSAAEAAGSAPGVGLGLALSRRLARDMGGDLLEDSNATAGASFVIKLRRAPGADERNS